MAASIKRTQGEGLFLEWEPPLNELALKLKTYGPTLAARYLGSALRKAAEPAYSALKSNVKGIGKVTGNLRRAVTLQIRTYRKTGNAVALVGFAAVPGKKVPEGGDKDKAFHAGLLEFGTSERTTRGTIASSYRSTIPKRAGFKIVQPRGARGRVRRMGTRPQLKPKYPVAFFARAMKGERVALGKVVARAPIKKAWEQTQSRCQSLLIDAMYEALENISRDKFATR